MIAFAAVYLAVALIAVDVLPWIGWGILALNVCIHGVRYSKGCAWGRGDTILLVNSVVVIAIKIFFWLA